jgi:hypothetical protein
MWIIRFVFPVMIPLVLLYLSGYWIYSKFKSNKVKNDNLEGEYPERKFRG